MRTLTCPPQAEFLGVNVTAFANNLRGDQVRPVLERHNLVDLDPYGWYPLANWMNALNEMSMEPDFMSNLVAIGMGIGQVTPVPEDMDEPTLEKMLMAWNAIYQGIHRYGDVGEIVCEKLADKHLRLTFTDMYPDDFSYGIIHGYARRFLPQGTHFTVYYDPDLRPRDRGGDGPTVVHVTWE